MLMNRHSLKTWPSHFQDILDRKKTFEVRKNDRYFKIRDTLLLEECDPILDSYTGKWIEVLVLYICNLPDLKGYIGMSIVLLPNTY